MSKDKTKTPEQQQSQEQETKSIPNQSNYLRCLILENLEKGRLEKLKELATVRTENAKLVYQVIGFAESLIAGFVGSSKFFSEFVKHALVLYAAISLVFLFISLWLRMLDISNQEKAYEEYFKKAKTNYERETKALPESRTAKLSSWFFSACIVVVICQMIVVICGAYGKI